MASRPAVRRGGDAIYEIALMRVVRRVCRDELSFSIVGVTRPGSPPHTLLLSGGQGRQYRSCSPALTHILLLQLPVANLVAGKKRRQENVSTQMWTLLTWETRPCVRRVYIIPCTICRKVILVSYTLYLTRVLGIIVLRNLFSLALSFEWIFPFLPPFLSLPPSLPPFLASSPFSISPFPSFYLPPPAHPTLAQAQDT